MRNFKLPSKVKITNTEMKLKAAKILLALTVSTGFAVDYPQGYEILGFYGTLEPKPVFSPQVLDFGRVELGNTEDKTLKILNNGSGDLIFKSVYLQNGTEFAIKGMDCPGKLPPAQSCSITVTFKPDDVGNFTDYLVMVINSDRHPVYRIPLRGEAFAETLVIEEIPEGETKEVNKTSSNSTGAKNTTIVPVAGAISQKQSSEKKTERTKPEAEKEFKTYTVKPCDTLWDISYKFYKTPLLWAAIYEANRETIKDPWMIKAGQVLKIPVNLSPREKEKYRKETLKLMKEMEDRPLGPKCPFK